MDSTRGKLLIAGPTLLDPNFWRTVVLVVEHTEEGALGLVLNRPSETVVGDAVPQLGELVDLEDLLYIGGPVQPSSVIVLAQFEDRSDAALIAFDDVGVLGGRNRGRRAWRRAAASDAPSSATPAGDRVSSTPSSSAGTGSSNRPAQWTPSPPSRDDLWSAVLTRKGGSYALVARMPPDPSVN